MTESNVSDQKGVAESGSLIQLGAWYFSIDDRCLRLKVGEDDIKHQLTAKAAAVLQYLIQHHDRVVSRQELISQVWQNNTFVGEKALNNTIWKIRKYLEDGVDNTEFIKTIPKTGYKLTVEPVSNQHQAVENQPEKPATKSFCRS